MNSTESNKNGKQQKGVDFILDWARETAEPKNVRIIGLILRRIGLRILHASYGQEHEVHGPEPGAEDLGYAEKPIDDENSEEGIRQLDCYLVVRIFKNNSGSSFFYLVGVGNLPDHEAGEHQPQNSLAHKERSNESPNVETHDRQVRDIDKPKVRADYQIH